MARKIKRILVLVVAMALAMPVCAKEGLQQVSSRILASLKVRQFDLAQEMKLFGQPALSIVFTREQPLDSLMQRVQDGQTVFNYADVLDGHMFLHAGLSNAHVLLHLVATSETSFRGELSVIENNQSAALSQSVFNEQMVARFLPWIPVGAQLLMDIELPGREMVLQQLYLLKQSVRQTQDDINARLLAREWVPGNEVFPGRGFWHKGNESLYVFVHETETGAGVYLMKKMKQAEK